MTGLSAAEARRAQTWNLAIACEIIGIDGHYQDVGHDRRWSGLGGFSVDRRDGAFFCFAEGVGGRHTVPKLGF